MNDQERLRKLEQVCLRDMIVLAGLKQRSAAAFGLRVALGHRARRFARDVAGFDAAIDQLGLARAALDLARHYGGKIVAEGQTAVPSRGPLLLVANHPGLYDTLAIYATVGRSDVRALSRPQPMLQLMPRLHRHLLFIPDTGDDRVTAVRGVVRYFQAGGAVILFPAGRLEPDPAIDGSDPLGEWMPGVGILAQLAARRGIPLQIVPTAVSGILAPGVRRRFDPLIRWRRSPRAQADLTVMLQLAFPRFGATTVRVRYGPPVDARALASNGVDAAGLTTTIKDGVYRLMDGVAAPDRLG